MKILSMQLFLVVILALAVNAEWKLGNDGQVYWDYSCDFRDPTFRTLRHKPSTAGQCGGLCIADTECKYFVHRDGTCFVKTGPGGSDGRSFSSNAICGYVKDRIRN